MNYFDSKNFNALQCTLAYS